MPLTPPPVYDTLAGFPNFSAEESRITTFVLKPVHARLRQLEVPLSVQYRFRADRDLRPYLGLGLVNYIFLREDYTEESFGYLANSAPQYLPNDQINSLRSEAQYPKHYRDLRPEWAGVGSLIFGLEQRVNEQWSVGMESYWRTPLRRLTSEDISPDAAGFHVFLRYHWRTLR
jgi:outer membrane protein W